MFKFIREGYCLEGKWEGREGRRGGYCGGKDATASEIPQNSLKPRNLKTTAKRAHVKITDKLKNEEDCIVFEK